MHARLGAQPFADLAAELYRRIDGDRRIRALFPADLSAESPSVRDMREFLVQFFGGPAAYSERKGHPRLRARHLRFPIDAAARDAWLGHALAAAESAAERHAVLPEDLAAIRRYLEQASAFMINL